VPASAIGQDTVLAVISCEAKAQARAKLSAKNPVAKAIDYSLKRWPAMTLFLTNGRVCLSNNAAERALSPCQPYRRSLAMELEKAGRPPKSRLNCSCPGPSADAY
jgi:transposase IS66 family protein